MNRYTIVFFLFATHFSPVSVFAQTDSLNHYLETAARNNPSVQAAFSSYQASLQKIPQAGAYQDPQLDMGFFLQPMELVEGRQVAQFQLMQMFPWFGTRKAARTEAQHMAKMAYEQFRETRNRLWLDVYTQWYTLCRLQQQLKNNRENRQLLHQLEELTLQRFKATSAANRSAEDRKPPQTTVAASNASSTVNGMSGMKMGQNNTQLSTPDSQPEMGNMSSMSGNASSGMSNVLRIQLEIIELENNIESLSSEIQAEKVKFNALLSRRPENEIPLPDSLVQIPFLINVTSAMEQIKRQNPMLGMLAEEEAAYKAKAEMDRKMSYPMFGIGLQYMLMNKNKPAASPVEMNTGMDNTGSMNSMNGKDMIMPMISVSIPIFRNKYKAQQRENTFLQQASREKYVNTMNLLEAELYRNKHDLDNAERKIVLYRKQSELAKSAYNLAVQEFASGKNDLTNIIQVQRQLLDYELKTAEAIATYNMAVANTTTLIAELHTELHTELQN